MLVLDEKSPYAIPLAAALAIIAILIAVLMAGCITPEDNKTIEPSVRPTVTAIPQPTAATAKEAFIGAEQRVKTFAPDAALISASGRCDESGRADDWSFTFDSMQLGKSYTTTPEGIREGPLKMRQAIGEWADSTGLGCGAGECDLEAGGWIVITEDDICEVGQ